MKRALFYLLSFTWGLPISLLGTFYCVILLVLGFPAKTFGYCVRFEVGNGWGGANFGWLIITAKNPSQHILRHEHGHGIQNIILGPFMPFLVSLPSSLRYHTRNIIKRFKPQKTLKPYDGIWFEAWASALGEKYCKSFL